jgi:hypothetical protein
MERDLAAILAINLVAGAGASQLTKWERFMRSDRAEMPKSFPMSLDTLGAWFRCAVRRWDGSIQATYPFSPIAQSGDLTK